MSANFINNAFGNQDLYIYVIDTDKYAGNFEREMCAFITGQVGECNVGSRSAKTAKAELSKGTLEWMETNIVHLPDDHGCCRPASIFPNPRWFNNGHEERYSKEQYEKSYPAYFSVAIFFGEIPPESIRREMDQRANEFTTRDKVYEEEPKMEWKLMGRKSITIEGFRWVQLKTEVVEVTPK